MHQVALFGEEGKGLEPPVKSIELINLMNVCM
jgi:hypothetical protein